MIHFLDYITLYGSEARRVTPSILYKHCTPIASILQLPELIFFGKRSIIVHVVKFHETSLNKEVQCNV